VSQTLLRLWNVEARYGRFVALRHIFLTVPERTVVALLGANGAGKTTMLRAISGVLPPVAGEITFEGRRISGLPAYAIAGRGLVHIPEGRGTFPSLSVAENLRMAQHAAPDGAVELGRVFELFPVLEQRLGQSAGTLSGGEQRMLGLARAFLARPRLLLLDELSLGLGPRFVQQLYGAVATIRESGTSILLVEQYVRHALRLADIVVVLQKGQIRFVGEPGDLERGGEIVDAYLGRAGTASYGVTQAASGSGGKRRARSR
jgi:branched-chain amino acid transport system ATP-binding protein